MTRRTYRQIDSARRCAGDPLRGSIFEDVDYDGETMTTETPKAPRNTEEQLVRQAIGHLRGLVDILGPCDHFDHHGYCQSHFVESPCRVGKAREFLESLPNAGGKTRLAWKGQ